MVVKFVSWYIQQLIYDSLYSHESSGSRPALLFQVGDKWWPQGQAESTKQLQDDGKSFMGSAEMVRLLIKQLEWLVNSWFIAVFLNLVDGEWLDTLVS